ncbi:MAG: exodeoxyribonuclease VII large subunit [Akkermansiaceae bacterium]
MSETPHVDLFSDIPKKETKALSVTQLVKKVRRAVEAEVGRVWIEGEVSNLKKQGSGHWYFSLKDDGSQIQCAMFTARRREGSEALVDGAKVRVFADTTVYEARGQLQVIVQKAELAGKGDLQARFEALKKKLKAEGLFDSERKKTLPHFPKTIGMVTSPTGAALQDILNILKRRAPWVQPVLYPVRVQGKGVEKEIANGIKKLGSPEEHGFPRCDVMIVGRGGGSLEDLWCFNEEVVARAIATCEIPIISAVGHEIDFTISDFVADLRAPTPSAAAELSVPDISDLRQNLENAKKRIRRSISVSFREPAQRLDYARERLLSATASTLAECEQSYKNLSLRHISLHPRKILERRMDRVEAISRIFQQIANQKLLEKTRHLNTLETILRTLGPESAFKRGFSITLNEQGNVIRSAQEIDQGGIIRTKLIDGEIISTVR